MDLSLFTGIQSPVMYGFVVVVVAIVLILVFRKSGKEKFHFGNKHFFSPRSRPTKKVKPVVIPKFSYSDKLLRPRDPTELQPVLFPDTSVFSEPVVIPKPPNLSPPRRSLFVSSFKGKPYLDVVDTLRNENPELNIVPVRDGSMLSKNVDHRRVRVFYNENGVVVKTPRTG
jgi:hypothetical protein